MPSCDYGGACLCNGCRDQRIVERIRYGPRGGLREVIYGAKFPPRKHKCNISLQFHEFPWNSIGIQGVLFPNTVLLNSINSMEIHNIQSIANSIQLVSSNNEKTVL